jgi:hypothetical protein
MKRYLVYTSIVFAVVAVGIVIADYFSMFGITQQEKFEFVEARFKTVDAENGGPVFDVHVRCFQKMNENACTQRDSYTPGVVSIKIPMRRIVSQSLFFNQGGAPLETLDPELHIMFIHPDYNKPVESLKTIDIFNNPGQQYLVKMAPEKDG